MITGRSLVGVTTRESLERMADDHRPAGVPRCAGRGARRGSLSRLGVATFIEAAPGPREGGGGGGMMGPEQMRMRLEPDGTVSVYTAQMPHGQGHETTFAQIAADEVGVPFEQVRVVVGDSDSSADRAIGTGGSRAATMAGGATLHTARALSESHPRRRRPICSRRVPATSSIDRGQGLRAGRCPSSAITLADVAARRRTDAGSKRPVRSTAAKGGWSGGTHCAIVEVDVETGQRDDRALHRRRGLRCADQPRDRRGPGARRRRAGHRRGAARAVRVRRRRAVPRRARSWTTCCPPRPRSRASRSTISRRCPSIRTSTSAAWARAG